MTINNMDDVIDSRDVIERIEELESEREALVADLDDAKEHPAMGNDANDPAAIVKAENAVAGPLPRRRLRAGSGACCRRRRGPSSSSR